MKLTSRRSFLEKLGLGAGAVLLGNVAEGLVREARGATAARKRIVFFLTSNGTAPYYFTPPGIDSGADETWSAVPGTKDYTWPAMVQALAPLRQQMLLVDGLANHIPQSQHSCGFGALSMIPCARGIPAEYGGPPGGITIDQFIAQKLGATSPYASILFGISRGSKTVEANVFASGPEQPEPAYMSPNMLFASLFKGIASASGSARQRLLLDSIRFDLKRLNDALAGPEKAKLERYSAVLEDYDRRQKALPGLMCQPGTAPAANIDDGPVEDRLDASVEIGIVALACGMTNVVGIASGCGNGHGAPDYTRIQKGTRFEAAGRVTFEGHSPADVQGPAQELIHTYHMGLIARTIQALSKVPDAGGGTVFDNMTIVYMNDNGEAHHATHARYPLVVIGNAGGKLKADGRFLRYPPRGSAGARSLADLFCTIATAVGAPTTTFGMGGVEQVKGPIPELLA
jgi:hypothetical protein